MLLYFLPCLFEANVTHLHITPIIAKITNALQTGLSKHRFFRHSNHTRTREKPQNTKYQVFATKQMVLKKFRGVSFQNPKTKPYNHYIGKIAQILGEILHKTKPPETYLGGNQQIQQSATREGVQLTNCK